MGMSSVLHIARNYLDSLRSARDGRFKPSVVVGQMLVPVAFGLAMSFFGIDAEEATDIVAGVSIVAALMCAVATLLFQTRIGLREKLDDTGQAFLTESDLTLVDELFAQVMWAILSGFVLVFLLLLKAALLDIIAPVSLAWHSVLFLVWCLAGNFVLTIGIVLRRLDRVYYLVAANKRSKM